MKRHLSLVVSVLVLVAMVLSISACNLVPDAGKKHEHTYSEDWSYDATNHWHAANCADNDECKSATADVAAHTLEGNTCSVCGYVKPADPKPEDPKPEDPKPETPVADGTAANPFALTVPGSLEIAFAGGYDPIWYAFTATETKTLSITLSSNNAVVGYGVAADSITYSEGETVVEFSVEEGVKYFVNFSTFDGAAAEYTVATEYIVKASPYETVLYENNNTLVFSEEEIKADSATRKLVIDTESTYQFAGDLFVAKVVAADGTEIAKVENAFTLAAGEYTVTFGMFSAFGIAADTGVSIKVEDKNADDDGDQGDVIGESDFIIGENSVTLTDEEANNGKNFTFVAQSTGTYTFSGLLAIVSNSDGIQIGRMEVFLEAGTYIVTLVNIEGVGGEFTLTISYTAPAGEDGGDNEQVGSEDAPVDITLPAENVAVNNDSINMNWYTFTTTEAGTLTIVYSNANSWVYVKSANETLTGDQEATLTFVLQANTTYKIALGTWNPDSGVTASISYAAGEAGGDEGGEEGGLDVEPAGSLEADIANTVTVSDADKAAGKVYYSFYPWTSGEYAFESNDLWVTAVYLNGTALETNDNGYYVLEEMTSYIVEISVAYVSTGDYTITPAFQYPYGAIQNPEYFDWEYEFGTPFTATYAGGYTPYWYSFYATVDGVLTVTTENTNAVILITAVPGMDISNSGDEGEWLGSISMPVIKGRQYYIGVMTADSSAADIVFTPTVTEGEYVGEGTENAPIIMVDGANTISLPQWGSVWFAYKAPANGTLTVTTANEFCVWYFKGVEDYATAGDKSIWLEEGKIVYLYVENSDEEAHDIEFTASFKKDPTEVYSGNVVADGTANSITVEDQTWVIVDFMGGGQYQITWDNAAAMVELAEWGGNTVLANGDIITGSNWGTNLMIYFEGYAAGTVNVTITPYVAESSSNSLVIGDNTIEVQDTSMGDTYELPVNADETVTYVLTVGTNGVLILSDGTVLTSEGSTTEITVPAGETVTVGIGALSWSDNVAVISVAVAGTAAPEEGGDEPAGPTGTVNDPFIVDALPYEITVSGEFDVYIKFVASKDCTLEFTWTAGSVLDMPSYMVRESFSVKSYKGEVKAGDTFVVNVYGSTGSTISFKEILPPTEAAGTLTDLGTNEIVIEDNTYVVIPLQAMGLYEITWTDANLVVEFQENGRAPFVQISSGAVASLNPMAGANLKIYLKNYAAGTAIINVAAYVDTPVDAAVGDNTVKVVDTQNGKVVNLPVSDAEVTYVITPGNNAVVVYDYTNYLAGETVEITVAAGATVSFNVCTENWTAAEVVVGVAVKGQEAETPVTSATGTYMSDKHASGRYLKVEIDAENGTMTLTRSNMSGGWDASTAVAEYTYAFDGTNVTVTNVSGQVCTCVFDANGVPTSITWGSAIFVNFAKQ